MDKKIENLKKLLESEKEEFLAVMSHELRTPMTGVKGYLSMILDGDVGEISPEVREYISEAYVANDRLIRLVDRMLKTSALKQNKIKFNIQEVDLGKNIELITHDFEIPAKEKSIEIIYKKPKRPVIVLADPDRLREIILNLVSNAVKFTQKGEIVISHRDLNDLAVVDVEDSGIGIPKNLQDHLFEIFSKTNLSLVGQEKGTGLGLFIAKKLAEAQGGRVWLERSEEGKGSIFSIAFKKIAK